MALSLAARFGAADDKRAFLAAVPRCPARTQKSTFSKVEFYSITRPPPAHPATAPRAVASQLPPPSY